MISRIWTSLYRRSTYHISSDSFPVILLWLKFITCIRVDCICGIDPVRLFALKSICRRFGRLNTSLGIAPRSLLDPRKRCVNEVISPRSEGMVASSIRPVRSSDVTEDRKILHVTPSQLHTSRDNRSQSESGKHTQRALERQEQQRNPERIDCSRKNYSLTWVVSTDNPTRVIS